jgi:HlyD family secretion protein
VAFRRVVKIGERNGLEAEVLEGISEGDRLVIYPSDAIQDGSNVAPRR